MIFCASFVASALEPFARSVLAVDGDRAVDDHWRIGRDLGWWLLPRRWSRLDLSENDSFQEGVMTRNPHESPIRRPADHSWMLAAWVLPLVVAFGITVATAGFGAMFIVVAIMIGVGATLLHFFGPSE